MPKEATDEDLDRLLTAMKVELATVLEMKTDESFFAAEVDPARLGDTSMGEGVHYLCDPEAGVVLGSHEECRRALHGELAWRFDDGLELHVGGPLEAISELPEAVRAMLREQGLAYDEARVMLRATKRDPDVTVVLALLRDPPAEIVAISFDEAPALDKRPLWPDPLG